MNDLTLRRTILDELEFLPHIDAAAIGVTLENGVVVLRGHVRTYAEKIAAERAVQSVKGVVAVAEELEVRVSGAHTIDDGVIASRCLDLIRWDTAISKEPIHIKVQHGWVTIEGNVEWQYQKDAVKALIQQLQGIVGIDNCLAIKPKDSIQDIKTLIEEALARSAELDAGKIHVTVHGNQVTLEGTVNRWLERKAVEHTAWAVPGVYRVENHLLIS
ncbi:MULTISPECIES: BON domain-containing protein [unclassified Pseudomonas]|uniref:BON domain-containing protein n=1 Tax=unclassified Pseudomonas TaxID=196821 RepID=UPI0030DD6E31